MSLLNMFGVGSGEVTLGLTSETVQAGGVVEGTATFTAGERTQKVERMVIKLKCVVSTGRGVSTSEILPETAISEGFTAAPGFKQTFPFRFKLGSVIPVSQRGWVDYWLSASADIDGELDPDAEVMIFVAPPVEPAMGASMLPSTPAAPAPAPAWPDACQQCGAPMPPPEASASFVDCKFCQRRHPPRS